MNPVTTTAHRPARIRAVLAPAFHEPQEMTMTTDTCKCEHPQGRHAQLAGTYAHCIQKNPAAAYGRCGCGMYRPQDDEPAAAPSVPADRAAVLREAAVELRQQTLLHDDCVCVGELRRMADEAQQAEPETVSEPFIYTDADAAKLAIGAQDDGGRPVVSVVADEGARGHAAVYVLLEDIEHVVAALRDARRNAQALHDEAQQAGCGCGHAADEHSVYGCADGCACEWMPKRPPMDPVHILGIRADETQQAETQAAADVFELPGPEVVAYRNSDRPGVLLCREHGDGWWGLTPLTSDDLPDGGLCTYGDPADPDDVCGRDVLIVEARQADTAGEQQ